MTPDPAPAGQAPAAPVAPAAPAVAAPAAPATPAGAAPPAVPDPAAPAAPGGKEGAPPAKPEPPASYALKAPDDAGLTERDIKRVEAYAREVGLTNEEAQEVLLDNIAVRDAVGAEYLAEAKADKDYGGDKFASTEALVKRVIDRVRPVGHPRATTFRQFLDHSAAGKHLEVLSFLADLGKLMAEDSPALSSSSGGGKRDAATVLYGEEKG